MILGEGPQIMELPIMQFFVPPDTSSQVSIFSWIFCYQKLRFSI